MTSNNAKRKSDSSKSVEEAQPAYKASKKDSKITSLKKADIIDLYEELQIKYDLLLDQNKQLSEENEENKVAISLLEGKAQVLEEKLEAIVDGQNSTKDEIENDKPDLECDECGYPGFDLCDLGKHTFEYHSEFEWNEVFECNFCEM